MDRNQIILIVFDLMLAAIVCVLFLLIGVYPRLKLFLVTMIIGCVTVILYTLVNLYRKSRAQNALEKKQQLNIIPGQCPDYWTRALTGDKLICQNRFSTIDEQNKPVTYSFTAKQVPTQIVLNDVANITNPKKCDAYGSPAAFGAPWVEMQQKCQALNVSFSQM